MFRRRHPAGLRSLLLLLFFVGLVPVLVANLLTAFAQRTGLRAEAYEDTVRMARLLAAHFEGQLVSTHELLGALLDHPEIIAGGASCEAAFRRVLSSMTDYSGFALADPAGTVECSWPRPAHALTLRRSIVSRIQSGGNFAVGEAQIGELSGRVVILVASAIRREGRLRAMLVTGLNLDRLTTLAERTQLPPGATFTILSAEGTMVAHYPQPGEWLGRAVKDVPFVRDIVGDPASSAAVESPGLDGAPRVFGSAPLEVGGAQFFVAVGYPAHELTGPADRVLYRNLLGLAVAVSLALLAAALGGESFLRRPIARMLVTANRIGDGNLDARVGLTGAPAELVDLARGMDDMATGLQLREQRLATLSRRLLEVHESERRAIARELHDEIGQAMTALKLMLESDRPADPDEDRARLEDMIGIARQTLQQVRGLAIDLRPSMLDHLGLSATLRWYAEREGRRAGFDVDVRVSPPDLRLETHLETTLFRIAQEAFTNIVRHAQATTVTVTLEDLGGTVTLSIRDNGRGFNVAAARQRARQGGSLGILGMEERVALAGGRVDLRSSASGSEVVAIFDRPVASGSPSAQTGPDGGGADSGGGK